MSLKEFELGQQLGEGAYSIVYKVKRLATGQTYALKKVKLAKLTEKEIENALNEVRILASINSNYIISYKQAFLENKNLCIVMEYADDGDLYQKIAQRKKKMAYFEEHEIWNVLIQSIIGLRSLHNLSILHRDLKSANIFLTTTGEAKLGDMNVSKIAKAGLLYTQTGTPYYASPEVWKDEPYDSKSDIWSLGAVIYEMTTLQPPFQAEDMEGLFKAVTLGVYPPINSMYSKELGHIIKLMLNQKPKLRPSAQKIFNSNLFQKKIKEVGFENKVVSGSKSELLQTIRIPKKLHYLTDRLPKPNYQCALTEEKASTFKDSPTLAVPLEYKLNKNSLPKVNQILQHNNHERAKGEKRKKKTDGSAALVVEGRSKIIEDAKNQAKSQEKHGRILERQLRDELRKIYQAKGRSERKNKLSHKSMLPPIRL